ncbi:hemolysin family protein [Nocardioides bruguierae]|uniref:hemolysin family protein n=1 Tax=Nocardioides bruguierae TaxID=2945102 RepID=UPI0020203DF0|nr:hemolysin family protein [Nocardioides bruguierae]MCL8026390.1 hemolysin family protein [Nocardioides bruguierae]
MDSQTLLNLALVLLFVLVGGVFAGTEIALVSLREGQLDALERRGSRGARVAKVARDPNRFLAAVQIGVTVAGFFSAAYGASTLAPDLAPLLTGIGLPDAAADTVALVLLTLLIAYLSLVLGELVPKRIALQRAAGVALVVGPPLDRFATAVRPVVWLLSRSTNAVVRVFGGDPEATGEEMTDAELRYLVAEHEGLDDGERRILVDVFDAADRSLREVMQPRGDVVMVPLGASVSDVLATVAEHPWSRYPVHGENADDVRGFVHVRDLLGVSPDAPVADVLREIAFLPGTNRVLPTLTRMRQTGPHIAVVVDEYGGTDGIVTLEDLVEELVGEIVDEHDHPLPVPGTSDEVEAGLSIEDFANRTGVPLPDGPYETAAGYVLHRLGRLAEVGDRVPVPEVLPDGADAEGEGVQVGELVVSEVDGRRITRLRLVHAAPAPEETAPGEPAVGSD